MSGNKLQNVTNDAIVVTILNEGKENRFQKQEYAC